MECFSLGTLKIHEILHMLGEFHGSTFSIRKRVGRAAPALGEEHLGEVFFVYRL